MILFCEKFTGDILIIVRYNGIIYKEIVAAGVDE